MKKLLLAASFLLWSSLSAAADCEAFREPPGELEPDQWAAAYACHKENATSGNPLSQLWLGRAHVLGVGEKLSTSTAAAWFDKAARQGNENAAFELAQLIYYQQVARGSYQSPFELYQQGMDVSEVRLRAEFQQGTPRSRVVELLMAGDGVARNWDLALSYSGTDPRQIDTVRIITRKQVNLKTDPNRAKLHAKVNESMSADQAIDALLCTQPVEKSSYNLFSVFAAVEAYGVPIEKAILRPCAADRKARTPLVYAVSNLQLNESTSYDWPRQLAMYLVFTRGDFKAFDTVLRTPLKNDRTISAEINSMIDETVTAIKAAENTFRKQFAASKPEMRSAIQFGYRGYRHVQLWTPFFPLNLVKPQTQDFGRCVGRSDHYKHIDDLPGLRDHYLYKVGGLPGGMLSQLVTACLNEPDYKTKMLTLRPYVQQVQGWTEAKPDQEAFLRLIGLGRALRSICRFEGVYGELPAHCRRDAGYEANRLIYWADNNRAGYGIADLPPAQ
ncbi:sel1 repeat family protein [Comamonas sp. lk]|uniref:tetratricopeptide repeat protein n=1 Tax=Comamonas sp. lk TaxID=2201272 RepID=UPI000EB12915|nr:sel1 repeat family protein [Comamonas sp. lk]